MVHKSGLMAVLFAVVYFLVPLNCRASIEPTRGPAQTGVHFPPALLRWDWVECYYSAFQNAIERRPRKARLLFPIDVERAMIGEARVLRDRMTPFIQNIDHTQEIGSLRDWRPR